jgi:hypothetical protein
MSCFDDGNLVANPPEKEEYELRMKELAAHDLLRALQDLVDDDNTPDPNCSCHISPPCHDCEDHGFHRELIANAKDAIAKAWGETSS